MTVRGGGKIPEPYDGQPFAAIGALSAAEHTWGRALVQRAWPVLGWAMVGRDSAGTSSPRRSCPAVPPTQG